MPHPVPRPAPPRGRGYTLVECAIVCAVAGIFASVALPSYRQHLLRIGRLDAVQALTRVQAAQEQRRAALGLYAADLASLHGIAATSAQGHYRITLAANGPDGYRASAWAVGPQAQDGRCATITLQVALGFTQVGPSPACWGR
ncbi:MAG: prepilin-type N-terminal cleavage/methylation domain-containing protein [Burkholderiales bacterium]|nr:prepilin-type N-terminal cleavage/methylation domain-containing protein [Burkholderiales bacterium]